MSVSARLALQAVVLAGALSVSNVYGADLQSLINAHINYVNGGIGQEEAEALRAEARMYPLELMFSRRGDGERAEFVAEVHLQILDAMGQVIVDRPSQGPIFLAHLPDGVGDGRNGLWIVGPAWPGVASPRDGLAPVLAHQRERTSLTVVQRA